MGGWGGIVTNNTWLKTIIFRPQALELAREEDGGAAFLAVSGNVHGLINVCGGVLTPPISLIVTLDDSASLPMPPQLWLGGSRGE